MRLVFRIIASDPGLLKSQLLSVVLRTDVTLFPEYELDQFMDEFARESRVCRREDCCGGRLKAYNGVRFKRRLVP